MTAAKKITLWFASSLLAISLFSWIYGSASFLFVFRMTAIFAVPVALLYLPFVITLPDAEEGRIWLILVTGSLIGPVCLGVWGLILSLRGAAVNWLGGDIAPGLGACLVLALAVGFFASALYAIALKLFHRTVRAS